MKITVIEQHEGHQVVLPRDQLTSFINVKRPPQGGPIQFHKKAVKRLDEVCEVCSCQSAHVSDTHNRNEERKLSSIDYLITCSRNSLVDVGISAIINCKQEGRGEPDRVYRRAESSEGKL